MLTICTHTHATTKQCQDAIKAVLCTDSRQHTTIFNRAHLRHHLQFPCSFLDRHFLLVEDFFRSLDFFVDPLDRRDEFCWRCLNSSFDSVFFVLLQA